MTQLDRHFGRTAFGSDAAGYDAVRPDYPDWVYRVLCDRCGLGPGTATFEIGAGTGIATRRLLELGADPLTAVEPDARLAAYLGKRCPNPSLRIVVQPFETAALDDGTFDLGASATSFHWLEENTGLAKVARLLRPGGWWAAVWNVFGDDSRPDPFHEATQELLAGPESPSAGKAGVPFALDASARLAALERTEAFELAAHQTSPWSLVLNPNQTVALYATYSNIIARADRREVLAELHRIASDQFQGSVTRNMTTALYTARRR
ncbi:class I SAM-dependent methyltransferase [Bradyrhizobium sp. HKCCYLRH1073]|uniref:class I SAM-dependent methyltransferase n=1 Tax=unclassified Bradyrhizobium TaxID=2631580 RepID=UPI003EB7DFBF